MSRQRFIYPEMFSSEDFLSLPLGGRLLFIGLITFADDYGRGRGSHTVIKAQVFPTDPSRPKDLDDAEAVIRARGPRLDVERIRSTLRLLEAALDRRDLLSELERLLGRAGRA